MSQRQRVQTKGCTQQKLAAAAAQASPHGDERQRKVKRQREKMVKISMLGLKAQHFWAEGWLHRKGRQRREVVSWSGTCGYEEHSGDLITP